MAEHGKQKVKYIPVRDLVLWTENPRDPISKNTKNVDVIRRALEDDRRKWCLKTLARDMGVRYDFSELPTVVYDKNVPIVFDGNRRVIIAMLKLRLYPEFAECRFKMPECPDEIPCNVADRQVAIENVWRKHADTGSWDQVSRDIFRYKFRHEPKSVLLQLDEMLGGVIAAKSYLNQRFVGEEVLTEARLKNIGIRIENGQINSRHNVNDTHALLSDVFGLIEGKKLSTRNNRTTPLSEIISPSLKAIVNADSENDYKAVSVSQEKFNGNGASGDTRLPRRVKSETIPLFGGKLGLSVGAPANLYRDILSLYEYYEKNKNTLSDRFPALIRMALRLECELIAKTVTSEEMSKMVLNGFDEVKKMFTQQEKTFLSTQSVRKDTIVGLLQTGAHNYEDSYNLQQTIAISLIVGGLLKLHCAKNRGD